jgi:Flp pilus assembly protein TadD
MEMAINKTGLTMRLWKTAGRIATLATVAACTCLPTLHLCAQSGGHTTVRHHREEVMDPVAAKLSSAEAAIDKSDFADAESLLKDVVAAHPNNYAAWYDLGYVYHELGRRDESIQAYKNSVEAKPNVFESNLNLGLALAQSGDPGAEQYLRAATKLTPSSRPAQGLKRAWLALGRLLETSHPNEAINAFREAAVQDPKDPEPHLLAGVVLEKQKSPEAEQEYRQALEIDPHSSDAMTALANLYMVQHRFSDAETLLRRLLVLHPEDASVHFQLARMLAIAGKDEDAVAEFEAGIKLDPSDMGAQRDFAAVYVDLHKFDDAERIYSSLVAASPKDADLHHLFGRALLQDKKYNDAQRELLQAIQLKPDLGEAYGDLAIAANESKNYPLTIKAIDLRAKYLPENPMTYFLRATAYDHLRDAKQASKYYHQFLDVAAGKFPEQEWQARHRLIAIEPK